MPRETDETTSTLKHAITELKQINGIYNNNYDQLRTRIISVLAAGFALLGYLYRDPGKWFIPSSVYGMILYGVAWVCLIIAFGALFIALHPTTWYYPMEIKDLKKLKYRSETELLTEIKDEYIETIGLNCKPYERKQLLFRIGLDTLITGGIILMVVSQLVSRGIM